MSRTSRQLRLPLGATRSRRGGKRRGTDSEVAGKRGYLPHIARNAHHAAHPVHVTMRRVPTGPSFRAQRVCAAIRLAIAGAKRNGVRVLHYSVQENHLHLMVEGQTGADLSNQMRTLFSRIAFAVNAVARRHGKLFRDRHHRHELTTPSEVRNALVYILFNDRKHRATGRAGAATAASAAAAAASAAASAAAASAAASTPALDPCSSAWWFHGWAPWDHPPKAMLLDSATAPTSPPRTWLAGFGWHRGDEERRLRFSEQPKSRHRRAARATRNSPPQ